MIIAEQLAQLSVDNKDNIEVAVASIFKALSKLILKFPDVERYQVAFFFSDGNIYEEHLPPGESIIWNSGLNRLLKDEELFRLAVLEVFNKTHLLSLKSAEVEYVSDPRFHLYDKKFGIFYDTSLFGYAFYWEKNCLES